MKNKEYYIRLGEAVERLEEKNCPTDPSKWSYYKSQAKKKFDVYPSAYANGWASKQYKDAGGGWKKCASEATDAQETEFHTQLDKLVHKTFGKSPEEKMNEKFDRTHLGILKYAYKDIDKINPSDPMYVRVAQMLDKLSKQELQQLIDADIKFISLLAKNRLSKKESVNESHFQVGDKVKMSHGGVGVVKSLDKEDGGDDEKYYNIELPNGEVMKHAPNELTLAETDLKEGLYQDIMRAVKKGDSPFTLVVIKNNKVIKQAEVKTPQAIPANYSSLLKDFPNTRIRIEDATGKIVMGESVNEAISRDAAYIHGILKSGQDATQNFIDDNGLDGEKLSDYVKANRNNIDGYNVKHYISGERGTVGSVPKLRQAFIKKFKKGKSANEGIINEDTKRANILGIDFNISEMNGRIFFSFKDNKAASIKIREIGTNKIVNHIQKSLDNAYGKGEFFFKGGDHAEFQNGYLFQRSISSIKLNKLKFESVNEGIGTIALGVAGGLLLLKVLKFVLKKVVGAVGMNVALPKEKLLEVVKNMVKNVLAQSSGKQINMFEIVALQSYLKDEINAGRITTVKQIVKVIDILSKKGKNESVNESSMSDIDIIAQEAKDFKDFVKEFYNEYKDFPKDRDTIKWLKGVYDNRSTSESVVNEGNSSVEIGDIVFFPPTNSAATVIDRFGRSVTLKLANGKKVKTMVDKVKLLAQDNVNEGNAFTGALFNARKEGLTEFEFNGKKYPVHKLEEEEKEETLAESKLTKDSLKQIIKEEYHNVKTFMEEKYGFTPELGKVYSNLAAKPFLKEEEEEVVDEYDVENYKDLKEFVQFMAEYKNDINEAEYQDRKVKLGKIMQGDVKKFKVYVKNDKGNVVKVNFGQGGDAKGGTMRIRKDNPEARASFRARHNCDTPGPRWKARYWSCRKW